MGDFHNLFTIRNLCGDEIRLGFIQKNSWFTPGTRAIYIQYKERFMFYGSTVSQKVALPRVFT